MGQSSMNLDMARRNYFPLAALTLLLIGLLDSLSLYVTQSLLYGAVCFGAGYLGITGQGLIVAAAVAVHVIANDTQIFEAPLLFQSLTEAILLALICQLGSRLRDREQSLIRTNAEVLQVHQMLLTHLDRARQVQEEVLGSAPTTVGGIDLDVQYEVAVEIGGDVFFVRQVDQGLLIFLGDISGKGPRAAIAAACVRVLLEELTQASTDSPAELLAALQLRFMRRFPSDLFLTCFCAVIKQADEELVYCNAGHDPPLLRSGNDGHLSELAGDSMPIGLDLEEVYGDRTVPLRLGDSLLVYTDGLVDARQSNGERLGVEVVTKAFGNFDGSCQVFAKQMVDLAPAPRADDVMVLVLHRQRQN